jgi:hypothetical protein
MIAGVTTRQGRAVPSEGAQSQSQVIAMWAHPRAVSTAFLRMMIERGDVTVLHEPLVTLAYHGSLQVPDGRDGVLTVTDPAELLRHLDALGRSRPVFFKDTLEYRHPVLCDQPELIAGFQHTFIVRHPAKAIASHYAMKSDVTLSDIGYEHQYDLFEAVWKRTGRRPVVITAEGLLERPAEVVEAYCDAVGLEFRPEALNWRPEDRPEWRKSARWHRDAADSAGFSALEKTYEVTVDNNERLRSYYGHHRPFYDRLVEHALGAAHRER